MTPPKEDPDTSGGRLYAGIDAEEGSNWEAAMAAAHYRLDNLTVIVDRNGFQQGDRTETTNHLEPLADKWRAFGWAVRELDGHDPAALLEAFSSLPFESGRPSCIIAHTHKGCGVSFIQDQAGWHHRVPTREELSLALAENWGRRLYEHRKRLPPGFCQGVRRARRNRPACCRRSERFGRLE